MKLLFDLFPVVLFFVVYNRAEKYPETATTLANQLMAAATSGGSISAKMAPILLATLVAIIVSISQVLYLKLRKKKVDLMLWISFFIITVFGGLTIYFQNDLFIKLKVTMIYWLFALGFLISEFVFKKNFFRMTIGEEIQMSEAGWTLMSKMWIAYFGLMGLANLYVALNYSQSEWVSYKFYSFFALPIFLLIQGFFMAKHIVEPKEETQA